MKSVIDFGALPDRLDLNSSPAFQKAADYATRHCEPIGVPAARFRWDNPIGCDGNVQFKGDGSGPYDPMWAPWTYCPVPGKEFLDVQGPTILISDKATEQGYAAMKFWGSNWAFDDILVAYPGQVAYDAPGAGTTGPKKYPPTFEVVNPGRFRRNTLCNGYHDLDLRCGRIYVEDCHLGGLKYGVTVDNAADTVRINNTAIQPFSGWGYGPPQALAFWCRNNGIGVVARRVDSLKVNGLIVNNRHTGILLEASSSGTPYGSAVLVDFDNVRNGVIATATNPAVGFTFENLDLGSVAGEVGEYAVRVNGGSNPLTLPRVSVIGGSIRDKWLPGNLPNLAMRIDGRGFRKDGGELHLARIIGYDLGVRR